MLPLRKQDRTAQDYQFASLVVPVADIERRLERFTEQALEHGCGASSLPLVLIVPVVNVGEFVVT
jgi:hypothetical protein